MSSNTTPSEAAIADAITRAAEIEGNAGRVNEASKAKGSLISDLIDKTENISETARSAGQNAGENYRALTDAEAEVRGIHDCLQDIVRLLKANVERSNRVIESLSHIEDQITQVGSISSEITSIAKQTNMLALNAMIEAQRAGSAGRGFAIVASEVKELAAITGQSADNIDNIVKALSAGGEDLRGRVERLQTDIKESARESEQSEGMASAVVGTIAQSAARASETAERASNQAATFESLIAGLQGLMDDNDRAVKGSARNMTLAAEAVALLQGESVKT